MSETKDNFQDSSDYIVDFDREVAWNIVYQDSEGRLFFVFEPGTKPKSMSLDRTPLMGDRRLARSDELAQPRTEFAFARAKEFLERCGYTVETFDD